MILSLALAAALPQSGDAAIAAAQRRFRAAIEASVVLGARFTTASTEPCRTSYGTLQPGRTTAQVLADGFNIDWRSIRATTFEPGAPGAHAWWQNWVKISTVRNSYIPVHPAPEQVGPLMAAANDLIRLCRNVPASPPVVKPVATAAPANDIAARIPAGKEASTGRAQCRFRAVPQLLLIQGSAHVKVGPKAVYSVAAAEEAGISFTVRTKRDSLSAGRPRWDGLFPWPGFDFAPGFVPPKGAAAASILLDGRETAFTAHGNWQGKPDMLLDIPTDPSPGAKVRAVQKLEQGSRLALHLRDSTGQVMARYHFDIATLRHMPEAIAGSNWTCA